MKNLSLIIDNSVWIIFIGIMIIIGWIFDIGILKSILPIWVTVKLTTAVCFVFTGIAIQAMAKYRGTKSAIAQIVLVVSTLVLLLIMGSFLISTIMGVRLGIEEMFVKESDGAIQTVYPGMPSIPTMVNFVLIAVACIITLLDQVKLKSIIMYIGWFNGLIGAIAILGYIINYPKLYFYVEGWNTAMALPSALLFLLCGICLHILGTDKT